MHPMPNKAMYGSLVVGGVRNVYDWVREPCFGLTTPPRKNPGHPDVHPALTPLACYTRCSP